MGSTYISERTPLALRLGGLKIWYDASDYSTLTFNGNKVSEWRDKSGNGIDASQIVSSPQPLYTATLLNGKPGLTFGASDYLTLPAGSYGSGNEKYTFVFVAKNRGDAGGATYMDMGTSTTNTSIFIRRNLGVLNTGWYSNNFYSGSLNDTDFYVIGSTYDQTGRIHHINGVNVGSDSNTSKNTNGGVTCYIGRPHPDVDMDMCEFMMFDRDLVDSEHEFLNTGLSNKWGT